jgi:flagellar hook protein FlgE
MSAGSFAASLSGLNANQQKLAVIGNNLANINTVAFKASTVTFADLVSQSVGGTSMNPLQIGLGVVMGSISPNFVQGAIESTGIGTNVSIQGSGFFLIGDNGHRAYTRAGNFAFDANGLLVTPDGQPVQGYTVIDPVTGLVSTAGQPTDILIPHAVLRPPTATTLFGTMTNLDANAAVGDTFTSSVPVYDALGATHVATMTFTKTLANTWTYTVTVPGAEVTGGTPGTPSQIAAGSLVFNGSGVLTTVNGGAAADVTITSPAWANGATATNFTWDLVDPSGAPTVSAFASPSATSSTTQNGSAAGSIDSIFINSTGELVASFGGGHTVTLGQLALANFNNPQGLVKLGSNRFAESEASGIPSTGTAGTGGRGSLVGSALEQSNVDIATEFTQMILAQRGYQANSKSITVADELLLEVLNMKR